MDKVAVRTVIIGGSALLSGLLPASVGHASTLPLTTLCEGTSARVHVSGFKDRTGNLRVQVYGGDPGDFLEGGKKLVRVEGQVTPAGGMDVCVPLPGPGTYAIAVLHDRNRDGRLSVWGDGVGFSRNPRLGLSKPDFAKVKVTLPAGTTDINVVLNYMQGLSVRPLKTAG